MPILVNSENPVITIIDENGKEKQIQNVYVDYHIPDEYKKLCTIEFLKEFRNQLFRIHNYSLDLFADEGIPMNTSTGGWAAALFKACINTNNEDLYNYWRTLPWYDSDLFDGELAEMLIDNKLILNDIEKYAVKYHLVKIFDEVIVCNKCFNLFLLDEVDEMPEDDEDYDDYLDSEFYIPHICYNCNNKKKVIPVNEKLLSIPRFFENELLLDNKELKKCSSCNRHFILDMGIEKENKFICHYCNDLEQNPENPNATDYYKKVCKEMDIYKEGNPLKKEEE